MAESVRLGANAALGSRASKLLILVRKRLRANPMFPPILKWHRGYAAAHGSSVLIANVASSAMARPIVEKMLAQQVDGAILAITAREDSLVDFIVGSGVNSR
jgi:DNA-binding LacI/PurR family transcriptional regulator